MSQKSCSYSFTGPEGQRVVLRGQAAIKAWLVAGGLEYLRGAANDGAPSIEVLRSMGRDLARESMLAVVQTAQTRVDKELTSISQQLELTLKQMKEVEAGTRRLEDVDTGNDFDGLAALSDEAQIELDKLEQAISKAFRLIDGIPEGPRKNALKIILDEYEAELDSAAVAGTYAEIPGPDGGEAKAMRLLLEQALSGAGDTRASRARDADLFPASSQRSGPPF